MEPCPRCRLLKCTCEDYGDPLCEDLIESLTDLLVVKSKAENWTHHDEWITGIQSITSNERYQRALECWCEENLTWWKDRAHETN